MNPLPSRYWEELSTADFAALQADRVVALLPVAAIEQHGPHLPVCVDAAINRAIVAEAVARAPADLPLLVLPAMPVGKSNEHQAFPGTLTLSAETLTRLWTEIGESVYRAGVRRMVIFNSHGGQPQVVDIVVRELRVRLGMFAVSVGPGGLGRPSGLFSPDEMEYGIHGGGIETSMMLHARPELVRRERLADFRSAAQDIATEFKHLRAEGKIGFGWQTQDLHPDGACGNALDSDAARGRQLVEHAATALVELLQEVARYPLDRLKSR
jgi:creatinine amidohydrolase